MNDMKKNDDLYPLFEAYDKEYSFSINISFQRSFNTSIAQGNAFSVRMLETLAMEAKKYNDYLQLATVEDEKLQ
jgi:hypothetical protein